MAATFTTGLSDYERSTEPQLINGLALDVTLHADPAVDLAPRVATLNQLLLTSKSVGSMLAPDDARKARWQQTIDTLWSTSLTDADVANAAAALNAEFNAITAGVVPPQPYSFSLNGRTATVPVRITNTLDEQLVVVVRLSAAADKLTFPEGDQLATLAPNTVTDVAVPVVARTNGFFEVRLDILTPSGVPVTKTTTLRANVSTLTGLAQVLTGAALLILITWWVHNYRRSRRVRRSLATLPNHPSNGAARLATAAENPIAQTDITQNDVPADHADASAHSPPSPDAAAADAADAGDVSTDDVTTAARTDGRVPEPRARAHSRRTGRTPEHRRPDL